MSENREPRISHLTKPRTRTLISSYRPFLESLTRSALTAYYRAHVVNWPSFFNNQLGWFPRLALCSLPPRSGWLSRKKRKKITFFFAFSTPKQPPADPHQAAVKAKSANFHPKTEFLLFFFTFFGFFSCSSLYTTLCRLLLSHLAHRWKPIGSFLFLLFPLSEHGGPISKMGNREKKYSETQNCISRPDKSNASRSSVQLDTQKPSSFRGKARLRIPPKFSSRFSTSLPVMWKDFTVTFSCFLRRLF